MIILEAIFPVFALLFCGLFLKQIRLTNDTFLAAADRLVYYFFFPVMLFYKIGSTSPSNDSGMFNLCLVVIISITLAWIASLVLIKTLSVPHFKAGTFSQAAFRFSSYIGLAVIINTLGESGIRSFGILIGVVIPVINILSVITLIRFGTTASTPLQTLLNSLKSIILNPLILGCIAGGVYSAAGLGFPTFIENFFKLMVAATMPLALISIGGALKFDRGSFSDIRLSLAASAIKLLALPVVGCILLKSFGVSGDYFKLGMIYFALPTSPSIFVLSSQMNSDTLLASTAVMISTLLSIFSLSIAVLM